MSYGTMTAVACNNRKVDRARSEWTITHSELLSQKVQSPLFYTEHETWKLNVYVEDYISIYLECYECDRWDNGLTVKANFRILEAKTEINSWVQTNQLSEYKKAWGSEFISKSKFITKDDSNRTFTIICTIKVEACCADTQNGLGRDLRGLFNEPKFSDVTIIVGAERFQTHKSILAARSPVFAAMFEHNEMEENRNNEVKIEDMEAVVVRGMLEFIYTNKVGNLTLLAIELRGAAEKYEIKQLKAVCEENLYESLNQENSVGILVIADLYHVKMLKQYVMDYIVEHISEVTETEGFKELKNSSLLKEIICSMSAHNEDDNDE